MLVLTEAQKKAVRNSHIIHAFYDHYAQSTELAHQDDVERTVASQERAGRMMSLLTQYGLTDSLYCLIDPNKTLLHRMGATYTSVNELSQTERDNLCQTIITALQKGIPSGTSEEGVREILHSDRFRHWTGGIVSFFYMPKTGAQKAAGAAAKAAGKSPSEIKDVINAAGPTFFKGLFRAVIIGSIVDAVVEGGLKIIDKIVNKGRILGSAQEVQSNIQSIKAILGKIQDVSSLTVAPDGSNADDVKKKSFSILQDIRKIYDATPAYTMVKGSQSGWTASLLSATGKDYDHTVNDTDALSKSVANNAHGELAVMTDDSGKPNPAVVDAVKERSRTVGKGIRLANRLVTSTTRVFTELTATIEKQGASKVMKTDDATKSGSQSQSS